MDLRKTIQELHVQKQRLQRTIAELEQLQKSDGGGEGVAALVRRRGRKSMGHEERRVVSERMKKYWASRRETGDQNPV